MTNKSIHQILEDEKRNQSGALNLSHLNLEKIPVEVFKLKHLTQLNLWQNKIEHIPEEINQLHNLSLLDLTSNNIQELPNNLCKLKTLKNLYLGNNQISNIKNVYELESLEVLLLGNNDISTISKEIINLKNLRTLIISGNKIKHLPKEVCDIATLKELFINDNPLQNIPIEYSEKSLEEIKYYFLSTSLEDTIKLYESKLLIVGEPFAGKTTLCKKLINPEYNLDPTENSTQGIEVFKYSFPIHEDKKFTINMWDFGGQEIYHSTHHFFLTKRSLYILLTDNRADNTDFDYWLNIIELLSNKSPVLIVQNEKQSWKKKLNKNRLRAQFENLISISQIDLSTNRGLNKLKEEIIFHSQRLPHIGNELPKGWAKIRKELEKLGKIKNFISYSEYIDIINSNKKGPLYDPEKLSGYFHDLGIFLHFKDNPLLAKLVILNTEWSTNAVYIIISSDILGEKCGRLEYSDFQKIWRSKGYFEMHDELLELMLKFELCYKIEDSEFYIFPKELPYSPSIYPDHYRFELDKTINLELNYPDFMPKGILTRFIVKMNFNIESQNYVWKDSVLLKGTNSKALVIEKYSEKTIIIKVSEKRRNDLLAIILNQFDKVHNSFKNLRVTAQIPCNCEVCKNSKDKSYYNYDELRSLSDNTVESVICMKSYASVVIYELLNLYENEMIIDDKEQEKKIYQYFIGGNINQNVNKAYIEQQDINYMKIKKVNITGGNQQFADKIINNYSGLTEDDKDFIKLVHDLTESEEEQKRIIDSLQKLKSQDSSSEDKSIAKNLIKSFLESGVKEVSKGITSYLMRYGIELLT